jgi:hypothetical protein
VSRERPLCYWGQPRIRQISITDRREIEFDAQALISIIAESLPRAHSIGLPSQRPTSIDFDPEGQRIVCRYDTIEAAELTADRLGALLVSYCIRSKLMLPRLPQKTVSVMAGAVAIEFSTHYADIPTVR